MALSSVAETFVGTLRRICTGQHGKIRHRYLGDRKPMLLDGGSEGGGTSRSIGRSDYIGRGSASAPKLLAVYGVLHINQMVAIDGLHCG